MKSSKLITLLRTFTVEEIKQFEKFLSSPYFSSGRKLKPFFRILKKYHPSYDAASFREDKVFERLYPGKKFSGKLSLHLIHVKSSELFSMAEKFLVHNDLENGNHPFYYNRLLAETYFEKELLDHSLKVTLSNLKYIENSGEKSEYFLQRIINDLFLSGLFIQKNEPLKNYHYTSNSILYIYAYIIQLLGSYHNKYRVNRRNYNQDYRGYGLVAQFVGSFDPALFDKECGEDQHETKKITLINYYILRSKISSNAEESFFKALELFKQVFPKLDRYRQYELFLLLYNRTIGLAGSNARIRYSGSDLIDMVWGKGIISNQKSVPLSTLSYISGLYIKFAVKNTIQLRSYIKKYSSLVSIDDRETAKNLSTVFLLFREGQFERCLKLVSVNEKSRIRLLKPVKYTLSLCCLFELKYFEQMFTVIENFERFCKNNKFMADDFKRVNLDFIKGIKTLFILSNKGSVNRSKLIFELEELTKNWRFAARLVSSFTSRGK